MLGVLGMAGVFIAGWWFGTQCAFAEISRERRLMDSREARMRQRERRMEELHARIREDREVAVLESIWQAS